VPPARSACRRGGAESRAGSPLFRSRRSRCPCGGSRGGFAARAGDSLAGGSPQSHA
jgi:hypothetical protein